MQQDESRKGCGLWRVREGERLSCANCTTNQSSVLSITVASVARATQDVPPPNLQQLATCNISSYCAGAGATWRLVRLALLLISFLVRSSFLLHALSAHCSIFLTISFVAVAFCVLSIVAQFFNLFHDVSARRRNQQDNYLENVHF